MVPGSDLQHSVHASFKSLISASAESENIHQSSRNLIKYAMIFPKEQMHPH